MALKKFKPMTAGTRWKIGNAYAEITTNEPEKSLLEKKHQKAGRNSQGRRVMRYKGGGHKNTTVSLISNVIKQTSKLK
ncbi:hypothetical protein [Arachidicoccus ginsenosidivorans]